MSANQPIPDQSAGEPVAPVVEAPVPRMPRLPHVNDVKGSQEIRSAPRHDRGHAAPSGHAVFDGLVQGESDIIGLLAYALYKQNKRDWLVSFQSAHGRAPESAETAAYIIGEGLPRRAATYRRLAEDMLSTHTSPCPAPGVPRMHPANDTEGMLQAAPSTEMGLAGKGIGKNAAALRTIGGLLLLVIAMAIVFRLAGTWLFGTPGR